MKSLFKTLKNLPEPLRKSGQYIKLPQDIFSWVDDGKRIPKSKREKYERIITGRGKLRPEDLDKLVENSHPDVLNSVVRRSLSKEEALKLLGTKNFRSPKTYARREEVKDLTRSIINKYVEFGDDAINEVFANGSPEAIRRIMKNNPANVTKEALQTVAVRPEAKNVYHDMVQNRNYDDDVAKLLAAHPDSETAAMAIGRVIKDGGPNKRAFLSLALQHPNSDVTRRVLSYGSADFAPEHISQMLNHEDEEIRSSAMGRIMNHEQRDHVLDNLITPGENFDKNMIRFLGQESNPWTRDRWSMRNNADSEYDPVKWFDSDTMHKVIDKSLAERSGKVLGSSEFWNKRADGHYDEDKTIHADNHFNKGHLQKLSEMDWSPEQSEESNSRTRKRKFDNFFKGILKQTDGDVDILRNLADNPSFHKWAEADSYGESDKKNGGWMSLAERGMDDPDFLKEVWNRSDKSADEKENNRRYWRDNHNIYNTLARLGNTPQEVIHDIMDNYADKTSNSTKAHIASHKNLDPGRLETFMADSDPNVRILAANNPSATPDQISRGLKDKRKEVRMQWLSHPNVSDEHLRPLLKDRAQANRIKLAMHEKMSGDLLHEMITTDKAYKVRQQAMRHNNIKPETLEWMMQNDAHPDLRRAALRHNKTTGEAMMRVFDTAPNAEVISAMLDKPRTSTGQEHYTPEQFEKMRAAVSARSGEIKEAYAQMSVTDKNKFTDGYHYGRERGTKEDNPRSLGHELLKNEELYHAIARRDLNTRKKAVTDPNLPLNKLGNIIDHDNSQAAENGEGVLGAEHLLAVYDRINNSSDVHTRLLRSIMDHHAAESADIENRLMNDNNPTSMNAAVDQFDQFSEENQAKIINSVRDDDHSNIIRLLRIADKKEHFDALMQKEAAKNDTRVMSVIAKNENADDVTLDRIYNKAVENGDDRLAQNIIQNPKTNGTTIRKAMSHTSPLISSLASKKFAYEDPDAVNDAIKHHESHGDYANIREIHTHPAVEKLKHIKGIVESAGGSIHKKELEKKGFGGLPNVWDNKGHVTPETIDRYIDTLPKQRYNISWDYWGGDTTRTAHGSSYNGLQRHDNTVPQKVMQVNVTNDQIAKMKEAGVHDLYKKMHGKAFARSHPVRQHSLGWARFDDSHDGHWHIDEVQSDLWSTLMGEAYNTKKNMEHYGEGSDRHTEEKKKMGQLKSLVKILQGPFKNPNHSIVCAAHEMGRQLGVKSTSMDMPEDQYAQSGRGGNVDSAKFKFTYQQWPRDNKYVEQNKKETMPDTKSLEPTLQYRKLVKSVQRIKELLKMLENDAS